jgi:hypothetical protein
MGNKIVMYANLPSVMQQEVTEKFYNVIGAMYDEFDAFLVAKQNNHIIELAIGTELDAIGYNIGVVRDTGQSDEQYRRRLKYFYSAIY